MEQDKPPVQKKRRRGPYGKALLSQFETLSTEELEKNAAHSIFEDRERPLDNYESVTAKLHSSLPASDNANVLERSRSRDVSTKTSFDQKTSNEEFADQPTTCPLETLDSSTDYIHQSDEETDELEGENFNSVFDITQSEINELKSSDPVLDEILQKVMETHAIEEMPLSFFDIEENPPLSVDKGNENCDHDERPLYQDASVSVGAAMLLLGLFTTSCNMAADKIELLLSIIGYLLPEGHIMSTKYHEFKHFFKCLRNPIVYHYYCPNCLGSLPNGQTRQCPKDFCGKEIHKASYFLEIPLRDQIRNLFAQKDFFNLLQHRFQRNTPLNTYEDIYDGSIYKSHFKEGGILSAPENISFTMNTDGAPVFKSSKISIWPIYMVINELPYKQRMKRENMLLASLWFGNQKPPMGTYLKPLHTSMQELYEGIECSSPGKGSFTCKGILLCGTADLPARSMLCNHIQYNGAYSCWKCEEEGSTAVSGKGHAHVYKFNDALPTGKKRTVESVIQQAQSAVGWIKKLHHCRY